MDATTRAMDGVTLLMSLLPVVFMIHDLEEIVFFKPWLRRNAPVLAERFPWLAKRLLPRFRALSTSGFAAVAALEFIAISVATYGSLYLGYPGPWFGVFLVFFAHLLVHLGQWAAFGFRYVPVAATSVLALPYCVIALIETVKLGSFSPAEGAGWALAAAAAGAAVYGFGMRLGTRLNGEDAGSPGREPKAKTRYAHTNIVARDWKRLAKFYVDVFDCRPMPPERDACGQWVDEVTSLEGVHVRGIHLRLPGWGENGPTLEIFHYENAVAVEAKSPNLEGFAHIAFSVDDVDACVEKMKKNGGGLVGKIVKTHINGAGDIHLAYARDPEGNIVEVQKWG